MLNKNDWKVTNLGFPVAAKLVNKHHYSHSHSKNAVAIHGLFLKEDDYCVLPFGLCWWIPPASPSVARYCSDDSSNVLSLSRMVLLPDAPKNSASFMLSRSIKLLPERYHTLVTYADDWQNHTGAIYRATNWIYDGMTALEPIYLDDNGRMMSERNGDKTRKVSEMLAQYTRIGFYRKHRFLFYRNRSKKQKQLTLF